MATKKDSIQNKENDYPWKCFCLQQSMYQLDLCNITKINTISTEILIHASFKCLFTETADTRIVNAASYLSVEQEVLWRKLIITSKDKS